MNSKKIFGVVLASFAMGVGGLAAGAVRNNTQKVNATELETAQTNFKLDWDSNTGIAADANYYKSFTNSGSNTVLSSRTAGTPLKLYDASHTTFVNPNPDYQITPYSGYKALQIRNYHGNNSEYYMIIGYGKEVEGSERDYGNFFEITPLSSNKTIKTLTLKSRDSTAENMWYKTSDNGTDWIGDLTNTYKLPYTSGTKTYDLSFPTGTKYLRVYQCNNGNSALRTAANINSIELGYMAEGDTKITFDAQNGSATFSQTVNSGDHLVEPVEPTKASINGHRYEFVGWFTDPSAGTQWDFDNDTVSAAITLYAHWNDVVVNSYTVTYVTNGDGSIEPETVGVGEYFTEPSDPVKTSDDPRYTYAFENWYSNEEMTVAFDFDELPTEDVTLYAKYTKSIADYPEGTTHFNVKNHIITDAGYKDADPSYASYESRIMDSRTTFDTEAKLPQIYLDVQGADVNTGIKKGNAGGEGTSQYDVVIKNSVINLTWADETKVLTFVRFQFHRINYQTYPSFNIELKVTGTEQVLSSCVAPGGNNHTDEDCVQATFTAEQDVRGVTVSVLDTHIYVDLRYIVLGFADETVENAATRYATSFNDAAVCGSTPTDGLNETKWGEQKTAYLALDEAVRTYLTNCEETEGELGEMLERYDRVVKLHGVDYDFMGRAAANKIDLSSYVPNIHIDTQGNIVVLITILTTLSVIAVGVAVITKKKHS